MFAPLTIVAIVKFTTHVVARKRRKLNPNLYLKIDVYKRNRSEALKNWSAVGLRGAHGGRGSRVDWLQKRRL